MLSEHIFHAFPPVLPTEQNHRVISYRLYRHSIEIDIVRDSNDFNIMVPKKKCRLIVLIISVGMKRNIPEGRKR